MGDTLTTDLRDRLASELTAAGRLLEAVATRLCEDPTLFARHAESLQRFDEIVQIVGEVANVLLWKGDQAGAIANIRLQAVRERIVMEAERPLPE